MPRSAGQARPPGTLRSPPPHGRHGRSFTRRLRCLPGRGSPARLGRRPALSRRECDDFEHSMSVPRPRHSVSDTDLAGVKSRIETNRSKSSGGRLDSRLTQRETGTAADGRPVEIDSVPSERRESAGWGCPGGDHRACEQLRWRRARREGGDWRSRGGEETIPRLSLRPMSRLRGGGFCRARWTGPRHGPEREQGRPELHSPVDYRSRQPR